MSAISFNTFNFNNEISKAIQVCGYTKPTPVQAESIPHVLEGRDIIACAQTGTGKTAAFVLPLLNLLSNKPSNKKTSALILTPTRELANQICEAIRIYGKFLQRLNVVSLVGGTSYHNQIRDLSRGANIIVATPGRLIDHMERQRVDLSQIEILVLDEADRMLDMGFIDDVKYISQLTPKARQTLFFSATIDKNISAIAKQLLNNPVQINLSNIKASAPQIKQELYKAHNLQHKSHLLKHFLNDSNIYKAIIFSATKINADKLARELRDQGYSAAPLHGDLKQSVRTRTLEQLRHGKIQYLVATDVAARGIDISDISHVINFDMPRFCEDYVHRIGRTGRAGKTGTAISFVLPSDQRHLQRIERYLGQSLKVLHHAESGQYVPANDSFASEDGRRDSHHKRGKKRHFHERRNSSENNPWKKESHKKSDYKQADYKKSDYKKSDHKQSDYRQSEDGRKSHKKFAKKKDSWSNDRREKDSPKNTNRFEKSKKKKWYGKDSQRAH